MKILLVDDDDLVNKSITRALRSRGFGVDCVTNGTDAIHRARAEDYDLILSDIRMPGDKDGIDVANELGKGMKCVLMTGFYKDYDKRIKQSRRICVYKPFNIDDIVKAIEEEETHGTCAR